MNSKAHSQGMRCLGSITILAGQRVTYYAAKDGAVWKTFDGMALTMAGSFDPQTEADATRHIQERQAISDRADYEQWRHKPAQGISTDEAMHMEAMCNTSSTNTL